MLKAGRGQAGGRGDADDWRGASQASFAMLVRDEIDADPLQDRLTAVEGRLPQGIGPRNVERGQVERRVRRLDRERLRQYHQPFVMLVANTDEDAHRVSGDVRHMPAE